MKLTDPIALGGLRAPNRLVFGPHETNLARGRAISDRHVAYYARRAAGGAGLIVTEEASVHPSDWPYERAPLAADCGPGWRAVADAVRAAGTGTLVVAALGHAGGQGSSAYHQQPLLAPSRVPEVNSREVPKWAEDDDITAVIDGFATAAGTAAASGLDGVEVNAGQYSLVRQFLSGLTNLRDDTWGTDKLAFARAVLEAARHGLDTSTPGSPMPDAPAKLLGLRLCGDELAPWAGLTPDTAAEVAVALAPLVDYLVVVRGSIFTTNATRPDFHEAPGFNRDLCAAIRRTLRDAGIATPVVLQGSIVDTAMADDALGDGTADLVEMTRAQIADAALGAKVAAGRADEVRPCVRCNQLCQVRDARNPIVSCIGDPSSGHETDDPAPVADDQHEPVAGDAGPVLVVGGGPAGLEAARVAALRGHRVRLVEAAPTCATRLRFPVQASGNPALGDLADWLVRACTRLGVTLTTGHAATADELVAAAEGGEAVIVATGSIDGIAPYKVTKGGDAMIVSAADLCAYWAEGTTGGAPAFPDEPDRTGGNDTPTPGHGDDAAVDVDPDVLVVLDPIGGPIGVAVAEALARRPGVEVHLVTQDHLAGNELARTGDLAPANGRLQQAGVVIERRTLVRRVGKPDKAGRVAVTLEDRFTGETRTLRADRVVDAGFRLPDDELWTEARGVGARVGDAVAPRTVHEAVLEARRAVASLAVTNPAVSR